ncbi:MAG: phosphoribosylamine--glycine ligase [Egibacteraceae bacterium]
MRVLVLGGGGREHALCWALAREPEVSEVLCAPGNAGVAEVASLRDVDPTDSAAVVGLARAEAVDLVVVGPEAPLVAGVADALREAEFAVFGPGADGARMESSKAFAKDVMTAAGVPTAGYWTGSSPAEARAALDRFAPPYVVKADGLAAGKGVRICDDRAEAEGAIDDALVRRAFGEAGGSLVIEEFLDGPEISVFALCSDTMARRTFVSAQDYKRAYDGDEGPNTGGMGAYSPVPAWSDELEDFADRGIFTPVLVELDARGVDYHGVLYAGLVLTAVGLKVIEFNVRFGDPEAQVILPRFEHLAARLGDTAFGRHRASGGYRSRAAVTVVLASGGYPGRYETGKTITGLDDAAAVPNAVVFHAGTRSEGDRIVTAGGRVLAVTGLGDAIEAARTTAYTAADCIHFDGLHRRDDVAASPTV